MTDPVLSFRDDLRAAADIRADLLSLRDTSAFGERYRDAVHRLARDVRPLLAELDRVEGELQAARDEPAWRYDAVLTENDGLRAQLADARRTLDELVRIAEIEHRGKSHSNAWHLRQGASRLDRGYAVGGGNHTRATARIARFVADLCDAVASSSGTDTRNEGGADHG